MKRRFENIFDTAKRKKGTPALTAVLVLTLTCGALVACGSGTIDIIGGADGSTGITLSSPENNLIHRLYAEQCKYIGSPSEVGDILRLLNGRFTDAAPCGIELHTAEQPYGITRWFDGALADSAEAARQAQLIFALIENADFVCYSADKGETVLYSFTRQEFDTEFAKDYASFEALYTELYGENAVTDIDTAIARLVLDEESGSYYEGECCAEGHVILGEEQQGNDIIVYAACTYGNYGFQNNAFIKLSGSGVIYTKFTFDSAYNPISREIPEDGSNYLPSMKKLFPKKYLRKMQRREDDYYRLCMEQERRYAEEYLNSIGREAFIGSYGDIEHVLPDMNTEASNLLLDMYGEYPYWIGTLERRDDTGSRYIYEMQWTPTENGDGTVRYIKYSSDKILDETVINIENGRLVYVKGEARTADYSKYSKE